MDKQFLTDSKSLPFCKGCGHTGTAQNTERALQQLGYDPLDVIFVTDIGCHGIIDKNLVSHTVHGLHGRSVAIAGGIAAGLPKDSKKKVIVFIGDGGATIGMQHLLVAAHHNFPMTVVVHNNMLYGMTGGQPSEFTPDGFNTPTAPHRSSAGAIDIANVVAAAGAPYVSRIYGIGNFTAELAEAFSQPGFSLVEVMELCTSYGLKSNPGMKLKNVIEDAGIKFVKHKKETATHKELPAYEGYHNSLISDKLVIPKEFEATTTKKISILFSGTASEGIQSAAEFLARTAMLSGLYVSRKSHVPVTVGVGFSASEVIISNEPIYYTGSATPDYIVITSKDGLDYAMPRLTNGHPSHVFLDATLEQPKSASSFVSVAARENIGGRNAAMYSVFRLIADSGILSMKSLVSAYSKHKLSAKVPVETFLDKITI